MLVLRQSIDILDDFFDYEAIGYLRATLFFEFLEDKTGLLPAPKHDKLEGFAEEYTRRWTLIKASIAVLIDKLVYSFTLVVSQTDIITA